MPYDARANRRRDQIITERAVEKTKREYYSAGQTTPTLWRDVRDALQESLELRCHMGHTRKAITVARAQVALEDIILRGEQLRMPI